MRCRFSLLPLLLFCLAANSQFNKKTFSLSSIEGLTPVRVAMDATVYKGKKSLMVIDTAKGLTGDTKYVRLTDFSFGNGTLEVELAGMPTDGASGTARGFVGIAFRMDESDNNYECFYLRLANGRAEDQVRRNHSVQYISHPDFPWERLRKESPEKYESYADLEAGKWTRVKILVKDSTARLYVNGAEQPTLLVLDLKHGAVRKGDIALWVGPETRAYFRNLVITSTE